MVHTWERNCANCWYYNEEGGCDAKQGRKVSPSSNCPEFTSKNEDD